MSEHLTHIAVYEDCASMVMNSSRFTEAFRTCLKNQYDSGMFASGTRGNHLWAIPILEKYRDNWKKEETNEKIQQQIAAAIGWITHRASDLQMKPLWREMKAKDPGFNDYEMQIYHDAVTFREVYMGGKLSTKSPYEKIAPATLETGMASLPASNYLNVNILEPLLTFMWQREFAELHQYVADKDDPDIWIDKFINNHQPLTEDLRIYIEAFQHPDPEKMERYIYSFNQYNPEDEIIQYVRGIQRNTPVNHINLENAVKKAEKQSQYAQALWKGYTFLSAASDFFDNILEKDKLLITLDITSGD